MRAAPDGERDLGLLAVIDGKALEQEAAKTGTGTTADGVVDEETLETGAIVGELANAIQNEVDDFFADGVVTAGEVISGILLSGDQLLRVEQLTVGASADLIDDLIQSKIKILIKEKFRFQTKIYEN